MLPFLWRCWNKCPKYAEVFVQVCELTKSIFVIRHLIRVSTMRWIHVSVKTCLILWHFKWETMREVSLLHRFLIDRSKLLVFNNVFIITLKVLILACIKALVLFESICVAWFCQLCVANWQIQTDSEELLIIKTRQSLLEALTEHVKTNHEYE